MDLLSTFLVASLVTLVTVVGYSDATITVTVDPDSGNDTACLSISESASENSTDLVPCRTLNKALGTVAGQTHCRNVSCEVGALVDFEDEAVIRLEDGKHKLSACVGVIRSQNLIFEAVNEGGAIIECTNDSTSLDIYDNLFFCGSQNISFVGLRFQGCGPVSSNVFFFNTTDILFDRCSFWKNSGSPLQFRFSSGIRVVNCSFTENVNLAVTEPDTGDTTITDIYNTIFTAGGLTIFSRDMSADISILDSNFTRNRASENPPNSTRPVLLEASGHGGAILIRLVGSHDSQVTIEGCVFEENEAEVDGGAVYISLSEYSTANSATLRRNRFLGNRVLKASGGAVSINSFNFTSNNSLLVERCNFTSNRGDSGGAFSMALYNSDLNSTRSPDTLVFRGDTFFNNSAPNEGTAVGLFSLVHVDQVGFPVYFENCTFLNNTSLESAEDTSAIAAFRFPTVFSGHNLFEGNVGGGITLLNTRMEVTSNSSLVFFRNRAVFGGGISMDDRCLLELSNNVEMLFEENVATESGGGIYVEFPPIRFVVDIFNRLCFLQYNDGSGVDAPPQDWKDVVIQFTRNQARLSGAAIFASDMQQCGWLGNFTTEDTLIFAPPDDVLLRYPDYPFQYSNNSLFPEGEEVSRLSSKELATSPSNIRATVEYNLVQPGETVPIDLLATDQVSNSREAIWSVEAPGQLANLDALSANSDTYSYSVPSADFLPGVLSGNSSSDPTSPTPPRAQTTSPPASTTESMADIVIPENFSSVFTLNFSLLRTLGTVEPLQLSVSGCHPGYTYNTESNRCECSNEENLNILRCDDNNRYLFLREGIWGGTLERDGLRVLTTSRVQPGYVECSRQGRLPGCRFMFDAPDQQCREGRKGDLCGECTANFSVTLDLRDCTSGSCNTGLGVYLAALVLVVIISSLILIFNIELPNELKGFIFYAQVVGLVYSPYVVVQTDSNITRYTDVIRVLLNLLGLSIPFPFCISESLKAHHVALLGYISPVLVLLVIAFFAVGARFIRRLGRHSALKGITFLSLFVYKYVADTAFVFIGCIDTDMGLVFQYDGSQSCTAADFIVFYVLGFLLVVFFVAPTPIIVSYICVKRPQRFQQYADVLTKGLLTKHRWWGGWDIGRRMVFVLISTFTVLVRPSIILFLMNLAALGVLLVHLFTKPFQKLHNNVIEAAILLNLLLVTVAFLDPSNSPVPFGLSTVLLFLPYLYAICFLFYQTVGKRLWSKFVARMRESSAPPTVGGPANGGTDASGVVDRVSGTISTSDRQSHQQDSAPSQPSSQSPPSNAQLTESSDFTQFREPLLDD